MTGRAASDSVCQIVASLTPGIGEVRPDMTLRGDLSMDSFGLISLVFMLGEETGVDVSAALERFIAAATVADIIELVEALMGVGS